MQVFWLLVSLSIAAPQQARIPTLDRLKSENLRKVREDVAALAKLRQPVTLTSGFRDLRCVLHAHSYLSHDSRGTIAEIAAAAKSVGIDCVLLTNHPQKSLDVIEAGQTEPVDGVLFAAGSEANGFLVYPGDRKMPPLDMGDVTLAASVRRSGGMIFIAHPEEHKDWTLRNLTGIEIYNTHADFKDETALMESLRPRDSAGYGKLLRMLDQWKAYPQEAFASLYDAPTENLARYDKLFAEAPLAAIAGNDSHQNVGFVLKGAADGKINVEDPLGEKIGQLDTVKTPILKTLFGEPIPGKELTRRIMDPYPVSLGYVSTHVLATERSVAAIHAGLKLARSYVAFDWMGDSSGTVFEAKAGEKTWQIGANVTLQPGLTFEAEVPIPASLRIMRDGKEIKRGNGRSISVSVDQTGVYRMEAALTVGGEERGWVFTGAIRVR